MVVCNIENIENIELKYWNIEILILREVPNIGFPSSKWNSLSTYFGVGTSTSLVP
jgi:hypothetical protein